MEEERPLRAELRKDTADRLEKKAEKELLKEWLIKLERARLLEEKGWR